MQYKLISSHDTHHWQETGVVGKWDEVWQKFLAAKVVEPGLTYHIISL